jgi:hypothetical protein
MKSGLEFPADVIVAEAEYHRLLGWPRDHLPGERAGELAAWARRWYEEHGRPWVYWREAAVAVTDNGLRLDGTDFDSEKLRTHLRTAGAARAMLLVASAGPECEAHARSLWEAGKPDEYFFLEVYGSAVVEQLVAATNGRLCAEAAPEGLRAIPHYSPGYAGWDVAEQNKLFALIARGWGSAAPAPLRVLSSGMLQPKKSLLAVVGLTNLGVGTVAAPATPCAGCSFSPCHYRREPYRHTAATIAPPSRSAPATAYTVNARALQKWSRERVQLASRADGSLDATFRFDGTTCSNLGHPLAFDYRVVLAAPQLGRTILAADCRPVDGDSGHTRMCAYLTDAAALMNALAHEKPLLGRPLDDVLTWARAAAPSGCFCAPESRAHKWGLALEAIHFALAQAPVLAAPSP